VEQFDGIETVSGPELAADILVHFMGVKRDALAAPSSDSK